MERKLNDARREHTKAGECTLRVCVCVCVCVCMCECMHACVCAYVSDICIALKEWVVFILHRCFVEVDLQQGKQASSRCVADFSGIYITQVSCGWSSVARQRRMLRTCCWFLWWLYCTWFLLLSACSKANKHAQNLLLVSLVFISHSLEEVSVCSKAKVVTGVSSVYIAQVSCGCPCVARETSMHRTCCWFQWRLYYTGFLWMSLV